MAEETSLQDVNPEPEPSPIPSPEPTAPASALIAENACPECGKKLSTRTSLRNHMSKFHPKAQPLRKSSPVPASVEAPAKVEAKPVKRSNFLDRAFFHR